MPQPAPLHHLPTAAIGAPLGRVLPGEWRRVVESGSFPVILHDLGSEELRAAFGPRELRDTTCEGITRHGLAGPWGLGCIVRDTADAAQFATAGWSWFTFDLRAACDPRAEAMSLDALDAEIIRIEDNGAFPPGWHEQWLAADSPAIFTDEQLARAAVRFAPALALAEQLQQAIRACRSGHGELPDVEISLAPDTTPTSVAETCFLAHELRRRGIHVTVVTPALGAAWPLGESSSETAEEASSRIHAHAIALQTARIVKCGICPASSNGALLPASGLFHRDESDAAWVAALRIAAERNPALFRELLANVAGQFPTRPASLPITVDDDQARSLPDVPDDALAATFLDAPQGRQLFLATLPGILSPAIASRLCALLDTP